MLLKYVDKLNLLDVFWYLKDYKILCKWAKHLGRNALLVNVVKSLIK